MVAEMVHQAISAHGKARCVSVEQLSESFNINEYDAVVLGFPTFHASAARPVLNFLKTLCEAKRELALFLFTTCALYSANALRKTAKLCRDKNLICIHHRSYHCAATDGVLIAPRMECWYRHEKNLADKVREDTEWFLQRCKLPVRISLPRYRLSGLINLPQQWLGERFALSVYTHRERCVKCGLCLSRCPSGAFEQDNEGYPSCDRERCIHCLRCAHYCPQLALSVFRKKRTEKTLMTAGIN